MLTWAKALPKVDLAYQGLVNYTQVVRAQLKAELTRKCLTMASQPRGAVIPYAELLASILDTIGQSIEEHLRPMQSIFCPGAQLRLLQDMQAELDAQAVDLVKSFVEKRGVAELEVYTHIGTCAQVQAYTYTHRHMGTGKHTCAHKTYAGTGSGAAIAARRGRRGRQPSGSLSDLDLHLSMFPNHNHPHQPPDNQ